MTSKLRISSMIWILFNQLWSGHNNPIDSPDWDEFLSHFDQGVFFKGLIWDHSAWCDTPFNCRGPHGEVIRHQMCIYVWSDNVATNCKNYNELKLHDSELERTKLLDTHNSYRSEVALHGINKRFYGASNIRRMTWDYSLEDMAINWALQCERPGVKDNVCRRIQGFDYIKMSEQRLAFPSYNDTWTSEYMVEQWAETLARYHYTHPDIQELHSNFSHGPWDKGTQMLWHSTYKVGCGVVSYHSQRGIYDKKPEKLIWYKTVVCYYAPPGNKVGKEIFKEGAPGQCPEFTKTRFSCYGADYQPLCHLPDDPLNKKIRPRSRPRENPPPPLYSHFVDATITDPTRKTAPTEPPSPTTPGSIATTAKVRRGGKTPIARHSAGRQLVSDPPGILAIAMLLVREQL